MLNVQFPLCCCWVSEESAVVPLRLSGPGHWTKVANVRVFQSHSRQVCTGTALASNSNEVNQCLERGFPLEPGLLVALVADQSIYGLTCVVFHSLKCFVMSCGLLLSLLSSVAAPNPACISRQTLWLFVYGPISLASEAARQIGFACNLVPVVLFSLLLGLGQAIGMEEVLDWNKPVCFIVWDPPCCAFFYMLNGW